MRPQATPVSPRKRQEARRGPGGPSRSQQALGSPRRPHQEAPGGPMVVMMTMTSIEGKSQAKPMDRFTRRSTAHSTA